jgi:nucleotide-binding universal stress UspA family protein
LALPQLQRAAGLPAQTIARMEQEQGAQHIAMGTRSRAALGSLFVGSVAQ